MLVWVSGCRSSQPVPDLSPAGPALRVLTYNVNWGGRRADRVAAYLQRADADVVCLQETHPRWEAYLKQQLSGQYPHSVFHAAGGAGGIAVMAKRPLHRVRWLKADAGWFPALLAEVDTALGRTQVLNVHLKPPLSRGGSATLSAYRAAPQVHQQELAWFIQHTEKDAPLVIAGDFNENARRAALAQLLANEFSDALAQYDRHAHTWTWRLFPGITLKNRYDHILFSRHFRCTGAAVTKVDASDHHPVIAVLVNREDAAPREP
jgi:endonuclease/exonuclease/phosphatase family metal-dependent hydrolase